MCGIRTLCATSGCTFNRDDGSTAAVADLAAQNCGHADLPARRLGRPFDQTRHLVGFEKVDRVAGGNLDGFASGPLRRWRQNWWGRWPEWCECRYWQSALPEQAECTLGLIGNECGNVDEAGDIGRIACLGDDHPVIKAWAKEQLLRRGGEVNVTGMATRATISETLPTFYWWFRDTDDPVPTSCPWCGGKVVPATRHGERQYHSCWIVI